MRLIDADALLKVLECDPDYCGRCKHDHDCSKYLNYTSNDICLTIQEAPTVGDWISVKDKMPKIGEKVLVYSKFGHISDAALNVHVSGIATFDPYGFIAGEDVKWWMPSPEPPEVAKNDL